MTRARHPLPAVISAFPVMNTAIWRATSSPGAAPGLTVQALRDRWRGPRSGPGAPAFAEPGLDGQLAQPEPGVDSSRSAAT
jgi:hypothetical protein